MILVVKLELTVIYGAVDELCYLHFLEMIIDGTFWNRDVSWYKLDGDSV